MLKIPCFCFRGVVLARVWSTLYTEGRRCPSDCMTGNVQYVIFHYFSSHCDVCMDVSLFSSQTKIEEQLTDSVSCLENTIISSGISPGLVRTATSLDLFFRK